VAGRVKGGVKPVVSYFAFGLALALMVLCASPKVFGACRNQPSFSGPVVAKSGFMLPGRNAVCVADESINPQLGSPFCNVNEFLSVFAFGENELLEARELELLFGVRQHPSAFLPYRFLGVSIYRLGGELLSTVDWHPICKIIGQSGCRSSVVRDLEVKEQTILAESGSLFHEESSPHFSQGIGEV
jgi:hypothetical protein